jgi:hypothetical protein
MPAEMLDGPAFFKPLPPHHGSLGCYPGVAVAQVILDQPEVVAPIRQGEAAGVPQHVRMHRRQAGTSRRSRDQVIDRLAGQCLAAFGDEEPGESVRSSGQVTFDRAEFVTRDRLFDGQPVLETSDPETGLVEVDVVAAQAGRLADAQAVAVHHQHEQVIADAVSPSLGGLEQVGDLGLVQVILGPLTGIRGGIRATFDISPVGHRSRSHRNLRFFSWCDRASLNRIHLLSKVSPPPRRFGPRSPPGERPQGAAPLRAVDVDSG